MRGSRPNILWICTDQQRYDTIGALGNPPRRHAQYRSPRGRGIRIYARVLSESDLHTQPGEFFDRTIRERRPCERKREFALSGYDAVGHEDAG